ncbi:hypothetical protein AGMMS50268_19470 [Spirochaetia bacterium]|nr:hypothetical protein AGMMS50268_19470 [Spirochaetia bacterium]
MKLDDNGLPYDEKEDFCDEEVIEYDDCYDCPDKKCFTYGIKRTKKRIVYTGEMFVACNLAKPYDVYTEELVKEHHGIGVYNPLYADPCIIEDEIEEEELD